MCVYICIYSFVYTHISRHCNGPIQRPAHPQIQPTQVMIVPKLVCMYLHMCTLYAYMRIDLDYSERTTYCNRVLYMTVLTHVPGFSYKHAHGAAMCGLQIASVCVIDACLYFRSTSTEANTVWLSYRLQSCVCLLQSSRKKSNKVLSA